MWPSTLLSASSNSYLTTPSAQPSPTHADFRAVDSQFACSLLMNPAETEGMPVAERLCCISDNSAEVQQKWGTRLPSNTAQQKKLSMQRAGPRQAAGVRPSC